MWEKSLLSINSLPYAASIDFGMSTPSYWPRFTTCRDVIADLFRQQSRLYFNTSAAERVIRLVRRVEVMLAIKGRTKFYKTNQPDWFVFEVADFWRENGLRRSFFTALIKTGRFYVVPKDRKYKAAVLYAMKQSNYFSKTWPAVEAFLNGYTISKPDAKGYFGWMELLRGVKDDKIGEVLKYDNFKGRAKASRKKIRRKKASLRRVA